MAKTEEYIQYIKSEEPSHGRKIEQVFRRIYNGLRRYYQNVLVIKPQILASSVKPKYRGIKHADLYLMCQGIHGSLGIVIEFKFCIRTGRSALKFVEQLSSTVEILRSLNLPVDNVFVVIEDRALKEFRSTLSRNAGLRLSEETLVKSMSVYSEVFSKVFTIYRDRARGKKSVLAIGSNLPVYVGVV